MKLLNVIFGLIVFFYWPLGMLAQAPVLNAVMPACIALPQSDPPVLTITGSGFQPTARVQVNKVKRVTEYTDAQHLETQLLPRDVAHPGKLTVRVYNPKPLKPSNAVRVQVVASTKNGNMSFTDTSRKPRVKVAVIPIVWHVEACPSP
ncbi:MAG: hypothetical protein LAN64_16630 [Acidobacteriia bacterium]|nr:hypothetical protein [Terriglobia bacterium]